MPIFALTKEPIFPPPDLADEDGLLAIGGDLSPQRLLLAYSMGIFPWFSADEPILWWSPDPRFVMYPSELKVSKSMKQVLRRGKFNCTIDTCFREVITACQHQPRRGQYGTWITEEMLEAYCWLHEMGWAHSVEVWNQEGNLVGGLYGVSMGNCFFGESMFALESNASKVGYITLVRQLEEWGIGLIDCQIHTAHLESLGARLIPRYPFLQELAECLKVNTRKGKWRFDKI